MWGLVGPLLTIRDTEGEGGYKRDNVTILLCKLILHQPLVTLPHLLMSAINNVSTFDNTWNGQLAWQGTIWW